MKRKPASPYYPPLRQEEEIFTKMADRKDKVPVTGPGIGLEGVRRLMRENK